ncbi:hypothetical protein DSM112329_02481 [Paraconexibacter sp. AEG42_29]|uniref:Uncharacterized protein n=1 Tax=Paraconexibacter sp. AEG42_29 TaxID=2997339 RepID=A0AAU7AVY6_9ACTN
MRPDRFRACRPTTPVPQELADEQAAREQVERERVRAASTGAEEQAALRRADKAAYLQDKLAEQVEADAEPGDHGREG